MRNSAIKLNTLDAENTGEKHALPEGSHIVLSQIDTYCFQLKELKHKGGQKINLCCIHCSYHSWQKGESQDKAMSNSKEIKTVTTSIVELRFAEGISE